MEATLINVFVVPAEQEEAFLDNWRRTSAVFRAGGALIEAHLHRNSEIGDRTFRYVNIARWTSAEAWRTAHRDYPPTEYDVPGVKGHPSIFEPVAHIYSDVLPADPRSQGHWLAGT
jgi:heme-degrading monooxygenase HmoA